MHVHIALSDEDIQRIAAAVAQRLQPPTEAKRWMNTREAAAYLGRTPNALHKLTSAREIPFHQDTHGGRMTFDREELDHWMASR